MASEKFPEPWGYEELMGNKTSLVNASVDVWRNSSEGVAWTFAFGIIPIVLFILTYIKTRSLVASLMTMELATLLLHALGWLDPTVQSFMHGLFALTLAIYLFKTMMGK